ncbi:MAG: elongation factor 4 [Candidatus Doudnabacteria bacterium CG10_big_fil_rev_8_21_14_0_10_42_18]|uniref:Elongation factor 4 n=1 Tax=Candidatus Doudnabacteria bacterium CG10_big_fil_rev_8_21_14_0_10_42_18 TaxID=1974552 RepID=A0A2H0VB77_9BACT|nr:MAG: elongation factor 4 [Candidatus Doudnabacteria bacterium CG10_big_fil_rev_8_21_14_0_10_42_18]
MSQNNIRNFCIIAHIDHGKSTLADRFLEVTKTVESRNMKAQLLDQMDLERERGITIKLQPVRMLYQLQATNYILNLIDTPGHVDFSYEVSRSLACCEAAILVVDASQGIEAQTLANVYLALEHNLAIIPVINKIDLPNANLAKTAEEMKNAFGFKDEEILYCSAKTGKGVEDILKAVIQRTAPPIGDSTKQTRALIFDSVYDIHRGVVVFVRVFDGQILPREKIYTLGSETESESVEVGYFKPKMEKSNEVNTGEVGYIVTGLRDVSKARVGDTITLFEGRQTVKPLAGYKQVKPMVYATIFPTTGDDYPLLRDAINKLKLSDASLEFEPENIPSIGFGFRCGFLGLLHMDIVKERLIREYDLDLVLTAPSVAYKVKTTSDKIMVVRNPSQFPDPSIIKEIYEPWMNVNILTPAAYIGPIMEIATQRRAVSSDIKYIGKDRVEMSFEMPLANIILDFYDKLKSVSSGYASLNYDFREERVGNLVKVDIIVSGESVPALSAIMHRSVATEEGRELVKNLKQLIPKHQFEIAIQAAISSKIIARETIPAQRKDVTAGLYGGDVTRKMKLLQKQKKGKKKMKKIGKVEIPQEAFLAVLKK